MFITLHQDLAQSGHILSTGRCKRKEKKEVRKGKKDEEGEREGRKQRSKERLFLFSFF